MDRLAKEGDAHAFAFTKPKVEGLNWSFSGLKTQVLQFLQQQLNQDPEFVTRRKEDLCASIQHTIVSMLLDQVAAAADQEGIADVAIAGGVSANSGLRMALTELGDERGWNVYIPPMGYCTDNAAMILSLIHI